jgi:hypothetical protein
MRWNMLRLTQNHVGFGEGGAVTDSWLCPMTGFGISGVEHSDSLMRKSQLYSYTSI